MGLGKCMVCRPTISILGMPIDGQGRIEEARSTFGPSVMLMKTVDSSSILRSLLISNSLDPVRRRPDLKLLLQ
jgi:hypothetical protein